MNAAGVVIDLGAGRALVGDQIIELVPAVDGPIGALAVGDLVLRPLRFGERQRVVGEVGATRAEQGAAARALAAAVLATACVRGAIDRAASAAAIEALALHLAGARLDQGVETPGFADAVRLVAEGFGWSATDVAAADADLVDRLARDVAHAVEQQHGSDAGWTSFVLVDDGDAERDPEATNRAVEAATIRDRLALDLLRRERAPLSSSSFPTVTEARRTSAGGSGRPAFGMGQRQVEAPGGTATGESDAEPSAAADRVYGRDQRGGPPPVLSDPAAVPVAASAGSPLAGGRAWPEPLGKPLTGGVVQPADITWPSSRAHRRIAERGTAGSSGAIRPAQWSITPVSLVAESARPDVDGVTALDPRPQRDAADVGIAPAIAAASAPITSMRDDLVDLADRLAAQLDEEADLRGVRR